MLSKMVFILPNSFASVYCSDAFLTFIYILIILTLLAQTTVNVNHRPVTQAAARLPVPRPSANHQVVYTTLPASSGQSPVRTAVMQSPSLRQVNPQSSGKQLYLQLILYYMDEM